MQSDSVYPQIQHCLRVKSYDYFYLRCLLFFSFIYLLVNYVQDVYEKYGHCRPYETEFASGF